MVTPERQTIEQWRTKWPTQEMGRTLAASDCGVCEKWSAKGVTKTLWYQISFTMCCTPVMDLSAKQIALAAMFCWSWKNENVDTSAETLRRQVILRDTKEKAWMGECRRNWPVGGPVEGGWVGRWWAGQ